MGSDSQGEKNQYISEWAKNVTIKKRSLMFMRARVERDVFSVSHRNVRTSSGFSLCPFRGEGEGNLGQVLQSTFYSERTMCNA